MDFSFMTNLCQLFIYLVTILILLRMKIIPSWICIYLMFLGTSPFWFNGLLFSPEYMPDQFKYLHIIKSIRNFEFSIDASRTVYFSGCLLALFPLPFVFNVIGVAFINKLIFLILFIFLYQKKYLKGVALYFILLYPDLILYSSLALRDILILSFMLISTMFLIKKKYFFSFIFILPLAIIKFQNFFLMFILWILYICFMKEKFINSKYVNIYFFIFSIFLSVIFIILTPYIIEPLDYYRRAMFVEDGGFIENYVALSTVTDVLFLGISASFYFLLKPFFFEANNILQIIQSFVNIGVFIFISIFTWKCYKINKFKTLFWFSFLMISMAVYGLVVSNFGTAVRYKFPFIVLYVVALSIEVYKYKFILKNYKEKIKCAE